MSQFNAADIKKDRLRFTKNKASSVLILLSIAANALYFVSIYSSDVGGSYYRFFILLSIVYNLVFMLSAFLASEGIKNYKLSYAYTSILLGALQVGRIFIIPLQAHHEPNPVVNAQALPVMSGGQFRYVTACLLISAALLVCAGVIGIQKTTVLNRYQAELDRVKREG